MTRERKTQGKQTRKRTNSTDAGNTRRWRSVRHQIDALDVATFDAIANTKSPLLDATMPRLTRAADRSSLWIVTSLPSRSTFEVAADISCSASMAFSALFS